LATPVLKPHPGGVSIAELMAYSEYMRERFSMAILQMPPAEFTATLGLSWMFRNMRDLFAHLVDTEDQWVRGIIRGGPPRSLSPDSYPDAAAVVRRWEEVRTHTRSCLESADEAELSREVITPFHGRPRFTVRQIFMHLLIHETHHRGQITAAMRMRGIAPPPSDFYDYIAEQLQ
jgi:uncharacterized damage-inducible protein DinB